MQSVGWTAGETAAGGAEGDAETLRQKDRARTELWKVNGDTDGATRRKRRGISQVSRTEAQQAERRLLCLCSFAARPMAVPASFHSTERMIPMEKKTPLYPIHLDEGGKMVPFAGYLLPVE